MPTIKLNKERVKELIGKDLSDEKLKELIPYLGTDLEEINEEEIVVEIFPNRPDLLSDEGFSRSFGSFIGEKTGLKEYKSENSKYNLYIKKEVEKVRPYTACAVIKGLKIDENKLKDIIEIQEKLHVTYGRNRKKCAIGIYPMENIKWPITYTAKKPDEIKFVPLEKTEELTGRQIIEKHEKGKEYAHLLEGKEMYPVFIDANNEILSMPPIINSHKTGKISESTKDVFIECSGFNFEVLSKAINIIVTALNDMGGKIYGVTLNYEHSSLGKIVTPKLQFEKTFLNKNYIKKYLGLELSDEKVVECLEKMGFGVKVQKHFFDVFVPCYRTDIIHQIDLIEDLAIGYGYDNIEEDNNRVYSLGKENYSEKIFRKIREHFVGLGMNETNTYSLVSKEIQTKLVEDFVCIKNSFSSEFNSMRRNIMINLLYNLKNNKMYDYPQNLFEIGVVFKKDSSCKNLIKEFNSLAVIFCFENSNFTTAKQALDSLFQALDLEYYVKKGDLKIYMEGRSGKIIFNDQIIGHVGEISPEAISLFELEMPCSGFELELDNLINVLKKKNN
ncbi:phenylalanine--tRNA ligase subunit beta [Candidatus Woesearchaeota archaeon]|nr:phenylalanine--tRNA ligase subunit beta [Candidatus Woesearchaeota archaeon]